MYAFRSKLMCLSKWPKILKTLACYEICLSAINYRSVMFYSTGPRRLHILYSQRLKSSSVFCRRFHGGIKNVFKICSTTSESSTNLRVSCPRFPATTWSRRRTFSTIHIRSSFSWPRLPNSSSNNSSNSSSNSSSSSNSTKWTRSSSAEKFYPCKVRVAASLPSISPSRSAATRSSGRGGSSIWWAARRRSCPSKTSSRRSRTRLRCHSYRSSCLTLRTKKLVQD